MGCDSEELKEEPVAGVEPEPIAGVEPEPEPEPVVGVEPEPEPVAGVEPKPEPVAGVEPEPPEPVAGVEPEPPEPVAGVEPEPPEPELLTLERLAGAWVACVSEEARSLRYRLTFTGAEWVAQEERFGEVSCLGAPSITLVSSGEARLGEPVSEGGPHALDLSVMTLTLTPNNSTSTGLLSSLCTQSFSTGEPTDISAEGCERLGAPALSACPTRFELVALEAGAEPMSEVLRLSARPTDEQCDATQRGEVLGARYAREL